MDFSTTKEYKVWKGFVVGLICCIPLIVMVLLHLISFPRGDTSRVSIICEMVYGVFYSIGRTYQHTNESGFFIGAIVVVLSLSIMNGVPYMIGARLRRLQQEKIKRMNEELHGERK